MISPFGEKKKKQKRPQIHSFLGCNSLMHEMMNYANFTVDGKRNKMAARGPHIQKFVILAATLCSDNLTIS